MRKYKEKLYLVKREVIARSMREALYKTGVIYEIQLADQTKEEIDIPIGFDKKKTGK